MSAERIAPGGVHAIHTHAGGSALLPVREEDAVSNISSRDISDEELGLGFTAIITVASSFQRTIDNGHLCSHCLLYRSSLSLHGNTDEYQYYSPLGGKWH